MINHARTETALASYNQDILISKPRSAHGVRHPTPYLALTPSLPYKFVFLFFVKAREDNDNIERIQYIGIDTKICRGRRRHLYSYGMQRSSNTSTTRRRRDYYKLVGGCNIHGIMNGEAVEW